MGLGTRIRQARSAVGLSIRALAASLNVSHAAVGHWETEVHAPSIVMVMRVAEVTGVDAAWLLTGRRAAIGMRNLDDRECGSIGGGVNIGDSFVGMTWIMLCDTVVRIFQHGPSVSSPGNNEEVGL